MLDLLLQRIRARTPFRDSATYWEARYARGESSGAGSYGPLAQFKAEVLNEIVEEEGARSVIEFGCGDGAQLALARYPRYIGLDVSATAVNQCIRRFAGDPTKSFFAYNPVAFSDPARVFSADVALSIDVIYHLVEDEVFEAYMHRLFAAADKLVVIYSSNMEEAGSAPHVRHRIFTRWVEERLPQWKLRERIRNRYPWNGDDRNSSKADFFVFEPR